jgi:hypothetical protein
VGAPGAPGATGVQGVHISGTLSYTATGISGPGGSSSAVMTATMSFGSGSYTWSCVKVSGYGAVTGGSSGPSGYTVSLDNTGITETGVFRITGTDAVYGTSASIDVTVTFPGGCVALDSYMPDDLTAALVATGMRVQLFDEVDTIYGVVGDAYTFTGPMLRVVADNGVSLKCSTDALLRVMDGRYVRVNDLVGELAWTKKHGRIACSRVVRVEPIGEGLMRAMSIGKLGDGVFWAGEYKDMYFGHHNKKTGFCVHDGAWTGRGRLAHLRTGTGGIVCDSWGTVPGVQVVAASGATIRCSHDAPLLVEGGLLVPACELAGMPVALRLKGRKVIDTVCVVRSIGPLHVHHIEGRVP